MTIGIPKERSQGESRVALVPTTLASFKKAKLDIVVEKGAGESAGFSDASYEEHGAKIVDRDAALSADIVLTVRCLGAADGFDEDLTKLKSGQILIGMSDPLTLPAAVAKAAAQGITSFSLELVPRTTRAQAMDVLSSQANLAGYKAVLLGSIEMPKILPMMTTAAGTIAPARVLIVGAGVAGLQAIATAKRLGAKVAGYDVRPEVKQQIESLGARFVELDLQAEQGAGGYAKEQSAEFIAKQQELMGEVVAEHDLVVTTAAVPGRKAPIIVTEAMVKKMRPGSVIVDIAAERGGNCELTEAGKSVIKYGVTIVGPVNLPSTIPADASSLYGKNIATFLLNMIDKEGNLTMKMDDPIVAESLICKDGVITNDRVKQLLEAAK